MLAVHKPAGMLSVPGLNPDDGLSLIERLTPQFPDARIVHRLDQGTSGVLVIALGLENLRRLSDQFATRKTSKTYIARVFGHPSEDHGIITEPLITDYPNRPKQKICYETGKPCETHWKVIYRRDDGTSILKLTPVTGRSHQLRVHCLFLEHPIIGDRLYAPDEAIAMSDRLELYAVNLKIEHPQTGDEMDFHAPCPYQT